MGATLFDTLITPSLGYLLPWTKKERGVRLAVLMVVGSVCERKLLLRQSPPIRICIFVIFRKSILINSCIPCEKT